MEYALEELHRQSSNPSGVQVHRRERNVQSPAADGNKADLHEQRDQLDFQSLVMPHSAPPVDEGWGAWLFCFSAFAFEVCIWGWNNTYGIFQEYYSSNPPFNKSSAAAISTIGTASLGIQFIELVFIIILYQRYPEFARPGMYLSLFICIAALLLSSFATKTWHMIVLQGVVFGISAGFLYSPVMVWLPEWFINRRGLATGIIFCGSGVGGFIFPLMMGYLLEHVGFRWTLRIWALTFGVCLVIALIGLKPRVPIRRPSEEHPRQPWLPSDLSLLKNPVLFVVIGITIVQALGFFPVSLFIPTYTSSLSSAVLPSRLVLALFNAASVLFLILFGRFSDSYPYAYVIMASGIGCALAAFVFWGFASSLAWIFAFATVFGGFGGAFPGIWPAAASEIGGNHNHITNIAFGCFTGVEGVMSIVGPIIAASLRNSSDKSKATYGGFGFRKVELFVGTPILSALSLSA
ncbi:MFS transporter asaE [Psilocybe cubensis]|uniref:MFS transporter asaE n=2 Tax=Psilocybe cubensis TaxID=181762 RepID=A0ACB8H677_PSICU|nr:MFS transporter asaE [Psilocybe cubensis]KAH9483339.1 MFS transporter asaE [Psilocybe cubensis]